MPKSSMTEKWVPIPNYENYEISTHGRVRSIARVITQINGRSGKPCIYNKPSRILKPWVLGRKGYLMVDLYPEQGKRAKKLEVHRLVAEAFVPNPHNLPIVMHLDDDPSNNRKSNLRWGTQQDNMDDKMSKDRQARGSMLPQSQLTENQVRKIKKMLIQGYKTKDIAVIFNVSSGIVYHIKRGNTWNHV